MWRQRNGVHGSQAPNWGSYLEGYLYLGKGIQREMQIGMGEVREENRELSVDELLLRCPRSIPVDMSEVCLFACLREVTCECGGETGIITITIITALL